MKFSSNYNSLSFDETKLSNDEWVKWKRRCAKHLGVNITDSDEVILASRREINSEENFRNKESI